MQRVCCETSKKKGRMILGIENLNTYELVEKRTIKELNSEGYILKHVKSGARVVLLSNDDDNKVFSIGFRTPPHDDTGLPHILEHSVLCGSKTFPAKDPFVELVKGSLNTFINAMTYPDKTVYPIASCNDQDFKNLMHVYIDAVLNTNIYEREEIFRQEGWNYNLTDPEEELTYNGVVYNEMKGAFSSPESVLDREILHTLFPDTCYAHESGGNPESITDLKYSDFLGFHSIYYHPANSYIYLYGNMDMEERLTWLDEEYLYKYDKMNIDSEIKPQKPFDAPVELTINYPITASEPEEDNTYLSYNTAIGTSLDKHLYIAFQIIEYSLVSMPGAPIKKALLDAGIGKDILGSFDNGIYQPYFSIIAKNANGSQKGEFIRIIQDVLKETVADGIDIKAIQGGINSIEFRYREADFGKYPKGLVYGLQILDSWLYDENVPFMHIEFNETLEFLKKQIGTGYFENLIADYLLNNSHTSYVTVEPKIGLTTESDQKLKAELQEYKKSLNEAELSDMIDRTKALITYQETPSSKEDIEKIPLLEISDIKKEAEPFINELRDENGTKVLWHDIFTNGIAYLELLFNADDLPNELLPYIGLFETIFGYMDTEKYSYTELCNEINIHTGGVFAASSIYKDVQVQESAPNVSIDIRGKALYGKLGFVFEIITEILSGTKINDYKRLREIISEIKSRQQMLLNRSGHSAAALRATSYYSENSYLKDYISGIRFYRFIEDLDKNFEAMKEKVVSKLTRLINIVFRPENLLINFTGDQEGYDEMRAAIESFVKVLYTSDILDEKLGRKIELNKLNEGLKTSSRVQYAALSGTFTNAGFEYDGALKVLRVIMNYDYLWNNIRVKGGAYGCMSNFNRTGESYLVSYRDPNLSKTYDVYKGVPEYLRNFNATDRDMVKYIIGTINEMDAPLTPSAKGSRSLSAYLNNIDIKLLQKDRDQVLGTDVQKIRGLEGILRAIIEEGYVCAIGNEDKIEREKALFENTESLFTS